MKGVNGYFVTPSIALIGAADWTYREPLVSTFGWDLPGRGIMRKVG